jgi:hypothetical protein
MGRGVEEKRKEMTDTSMDISQLVDLLAQVIQLPLDPAHRPGVIANFERTMTIAQLVMEFPLPDEIEVAPVFEP